MPTVNCEGLTCIRSSLPQPSSLWFNKHTCLCGAHSLAGNRQQAHNRSSSFVLNLLSSDQEHWIQGSMTINLLLKWNKQAHFYSQKRGVSSIGSTHPFLFISTYHARHWKLCAYFNGVSGFNAKSSAAFFLTYTGKQVVRTSAHNMGYILRIIKPPRFYYALYH